MTKEVQFRRGTTTQHSVFTGALAEVTVDTDKKVVVVHDGVTAGGQEMVGRTATQTLTNKTLTSPTISGGSIDNAPVGATTRNTGAFTSLDANGNVILGSDTNDTVTINGLVNSTVTFSGANSHLTLTGELRGPSTFIIDPSTVGDETGTVRIRGDLEVLGTTTTINSTVTTIADPFLELRRGANIAAADGGVQVNLTTNGSSVVTAFQRLQWDNNNSRWEFTDGSIDKPIVNTYDTFLLASNTGSITVGPTTIDSTLSINGNGTSGTASLNSNVTAGTGNIFTGITGTGNLFTGVTGNVNIAGAAGTVNIGTTGGNSTLNIRGNGTGGTATIGTNVTTGIAEIFLGVTGGIHFGPTLNIGTTSQNATINLRGNGTGGTSTIATNVTTGIVDFVTGVTTGTVNIATGVTTGSVNIATGGASQIALGGIGASAILRGATVANAPAVAANGQLRLFALNNTTGAPGIPHYRGAAGDFRVVQSSFGGAKVAYWAAIPQATTGSIVGLQGLTNATGTTATARTPATTNISTRLHRIGYVATATAGNFGGIYFTQANYTIGDTAGLGGFYSVFRWTVQDASAVTGARMFIGWSSSVAAPTNVEPNTLTNSFGIAQLSTDATQLYMVQGGSAAQTAIALGTGLGAPTNTGAAFEMVLYAPPNLNNTVYYQVRNLNTANTVSGTLTAGTPGTQLPAATTYLAPRAWRCNNAQNLAVALDLSSIYVDTDF